MPARVDQARTTFLSGARRQALRIDVPRVMVDEQRIIQVLNNLFSNAARHAPDWCPIRVTALRDGVHVAVSVAEQGRGVPPDQLPHRFRKHARVGGSEGGMGGTGLGRSICKGLVGAHGGRLRADSGGPGRGTRITFTIPVAADTEVATRAASTRSPARGTSSSGSR